MAVGNSLAILMPAAGEQPSSNFAAFDLFNQRPVLLFDATTEEGMCFTYRMPAQYAGGNIKILLNMSAVSATSGTVGWLVNFEKDTGAALGSDNFAADQTVVAVTVAGATGTEFSSNLTITAGSATASIAAGDLFRIKVRRNVAVDTATGDARLHAIELQEAA